MIVILTKAQFMELLRKAIDTDEKYPQLRHVEFLLERATDHEDWIELELLTQ